MGDDLDDTQGIEVAARKQELMTLYAQKQKEYDEFVKEEERKEKLATPKASSCEVCGTAYSGDDEYQQHLKYKMHGVYLQIQEHMAMLQKKKEAREKKQADEPKK